MPLSIKNPEADRLARQLADATGETLTEAVITALKERLIRQGGRTRTPRLAEQLREIRKRCSSLPVLDRRTPEEILEYDRNGLPR